MRSTLASVTTFRHRPGLTLAMVLTLALGLGATTTVYSFVDALLLRPLAYPEGDRLVTVFETSPENPRRGAAPANFLDWRRESRTLASMAGSFSGDRTLESAAGAERARGASVSGNFFSVLGATAAIGRTFQPAEDDEPGALRVVLSDRAWRDQFSADPAIVGRRVRIDEVAHEVVGVMPSGFSTPTDEARFWTLGDRGVPRLAGVADVTSSRDIHYFTVVGRLAPDATLETARTELSALAARMALQYPETNRDLGVNPVALRDAVVGDRARTVLLLLGVVGFVLLIAGANTANLMITATAARAREFAVRSAVGATRGQIIRPVIAEGAIIAGVAGLLGIAAATVAVRLLAATVPLALPSATTPSVDLRVVAAALVASILVGVLASLVPALRAGTEAAIANFLRGGRGISHRGHRLQRALAALQVGLSLTLLVGAGLLVHGYRKLAEVDPGFHAEGLGTIDISLSRASYASPELVAAFYERVLAATAASPGVTAVSAISNLPTSGRSMNRGLRIEGRPAPERATDQTIEYQAAAPGYFETMGIELAAGRGIDARDDRAAPRVAVINEVARRRYWPDEDPLGARLRFTLQDGTVVLPTIVGVVHDVRHFGLDRAPAPEVYVPLAQDPSRSMTLVFRRANGAGDAAIHQLVRDADPTQPSATPRTMEDRLGESMARPRVLSRVLTVFASLALALAAIGLYGLLAQLVDARTRELGVRLALGALPRQVVMLVLRDALALVAAGVLIGTAGALALTRILSSLLFGVSPTDPLVFVSMVALLVVASALAAALPATRAARLQPALVLGSE